MLLLASPVTQSLAVGGTLTFGTGCGDSLTHADCEQWRTDCIELCADDDLSCVSTCEENYDLCWVDAEAAAERRRDAAAAAGEIALACAAVFVCTLESLEDEDSEQPGPMPGEGEGLEADDEQVQSLDDELELDVPVDLPG